jgi:membrane protein
MGAEREEPAAPLLWSNGLSSDFGFRISFGIRNSGFGFIPESVSISPSMAEKLSWFRRMQAAAAACWDESVWRIQGEPSRLHRFVHFWVLVTRSFIRNRCPVRASALSYATLLALIPMLAVALSVTSSLLKSEGEAEIYRFIDKMVSTMMPTTRGGISLPPAMVAAGIGPSALAATNPILVVQQQPTNSPALAATGSTNSLESASTVGPEGTDDVTPVHNDRMTAAQKEAARQIHEFIRNARSGTLGVTGMIGIIFVAILMLGRIEETFNDIWGVTRGRSWAMRILLYWGVITLGPLLLAGALALAGSHHMQGTQDFINGMPFHLGTFLVKLLPVVVLWVTFALFYKLVPNTPVDFTAAAVGGLVGGSFWHINNLFSVIYASRVVNNSKIYGGLGMVLVFMAGLYFSWLTLLFGAQVAYGFQNRALYLQDKLAENVNQRGREFIALRLMTCLGRRFQVGMAPPTIQQMSGELGVPSRLIQQVLRTLLAARLVTEISGAEPAYAPARPLETINAHHVLLAMRASQGQELITAGETLQSEVYGEYARIEAAEKQAASAVTLLTLVNRTSPRRELPGNPSVIENGAAAQKLPVEPASTVAAAPLEPVKVATPVPVTVAIGVVAPTTAPAPVPPTFVVAEPSPSNKTDAPAPIVEPVADSDRDFPL